MGEVQDKDSCDFKAEISSTIGKRESTFLFPDLTTFFRLGLLSTFPVYSTFLFPDLTTFFRLGLLSTFLFPNCTTDFSLEIAGIFVLHFGLLFCGCRQSLTWLCQCVPLFRW